MPAMVRKLYLCLFLGPQCVGAAADLRSKTKGAPCQGAVLWLHGFDDSSHWWSRLLPAKALALGATTQTGAWWHLQAPKLAQPFFGHRRMTAWGHFLSADRLEPLSEDHEETKSYEACGGAHTAGAGSSAAGLPLGAAPGKTHLYNIYNM